MKAKTAKAKGDRFEKYVLSILNEEIDPKAKQTKASGAGLAKGDIYAPTIDWLIECKNHKQISMPSWIEQMDKERDNVNTSMIMFKNPNTPDTNPEVMVCLRLEDLIEITKKKSEIVVETKDNNRELSWALNDLIRASKKVDKLIK